MLLFKIFCKKKKVEGAPRVKEAEASPKKAPPKRKGYRQFGVSFPSRLIKEMDNYRNSLPVAISRTAWMAKVIRKSLRERKR